MPLPDTPMSGLSIRIGKQWPVAVWRFGVCGMTRADGLPSGVPKAGLSREWPLIFYAMT